MTESARERLVIWAIRHLDPDAYAITIRDMLAADTGIRLSLGTIYNILARLEKDGTAMSYWGEATLERGYRRKRLYRITELPS